jgi:hypothetical protein
VALSGLCEDARAASGAVSVRGVNSSFPFLTAFLYIPVFRKAVIYIMSMAL